MNAALIGFRVNVASSMYEIKEETVITDKGFKSFENSEKFHSSLYMNNFVIRSCTEKNKTRVTLIAPIKNLLYYPLPKEITPKLINSMDIGAGVYIVHYPNPKSVTEIGGKKTQCFESIDGLFCVHSNTGKNYPLAYYKDRGWSMLVSDGNDYPGELEGSKRMGPDKVEDITSLLILEISRRRDAVSLTGP